MSLIRMAGTCPVPPLAGWAGSFTYPKVVLEMVLNESVVQ